MHRYCTEVDKLFHYHCFALPVLVVVRGLNYCTSSGSLLYSIVLERKKSFVFEDLFDTLHLVHWLKNECTVSSFVR